MWPGSGRGATPSLGAEWQSGDIYVALLAEAQKTKAKTQTEPRAESRLQHKSLAKATPPGLARPGCLLPPRQDTLWFPRPVSGPARCAGGPGSQDNSGKWPLFSHSACPNKHCESQTGHSCWPQLAGWGGGGEGSEALTQPSNCTWLCLQPLSHPSPKPHSCGKQCGRKQKGSHPPVSCKVTPVSHGPCHLLPS